MKILSHQVDILDLAQKLQPRLLEIIENSSFSGCDFLRTRFMTMPGTSRSRLWAFICSLVQCFPCQSGCCREYREMRDRQGVTLSDATPPNRSDYPTHELFLRAMREWSTRELDQFNLISPNILKNDERSTKLLNF